MLALTAYAVETRHLYVAPDGDDQWTGRFADPLPNGLDGPLATPAGARDRLRVLRKAPEGLTTPVAVFLRTGTYALEAPLVFEPEDSGTAEAPITYAAFPGESPVISGGRPILNWQVDGAAWRASLPRTLSEGWRFGVLYVDGALGLPARTPNWDGRRESLSASSFLRSVGPGPLLRDSLAVNPVDVPNFTNPADVLFMVVHAWDSSYHRLAPGLAVPGLVNFLPNYPGFAVFDHFDFGTWETEQPYCILHAKEALDAPGEWWLDTAAGVLHYRPKPGETPDNTVVVAPVAQRLIEIAGSAEAPVTHLHFKDLHFAHANYAFGPDAPNATYNGLGSTLGPNIVPGAFLADGWQQSRIEGCIFSQLAGYAVELRFHCSEVTLTHNEMTVLGAGGVVIGKDLTTTNHHIDIDNNWIHDGGTLFPGTIPIRLGRTSNNSVTHNEVSDFYLSGISAGDSLNYDPSTASDNLIAYNHVHHLGPGMLSDMGGIYTTGVSPGTEIRNNLVHDVFHAPGGYGGWGIYLDEGSSETVVRDNVVHSTSSGGFHLHYGRDNLVENNIFAWSHSRQIERTRAEPEPRESLNVQRNIFYFTNGLGFAGNWLDKKYRFDYNTYWAVGADDFVFPFGAFANWQAEGFDTHGRLLDPQFADPEAFDFSLPPTSPAVVQTGFAPIDVSGVGLYGNNAWVNAPRLIARAPTALPTEPEAVAYVYTFEDTDLDALPPDLQAYGMGGAATVGVANDQAARGVQSLRLNDAPGLPFLWDPHAYVRPNYRDGYAVERFRLRLSAGAYLFHEWRDQLADGYTLGPAISIDADGLKVLGVLQDPFPREVWCQLEIGAPLGESADGSFQMRLWTPTAGWSPVRTHAHGSPDFRRIAWVGLLSYTDAFTSIHIDDYELFVTAVDADGDGDGIPDAVEGMLDLGEDGLANHLDLDSDGDAVPDADEYFADALLDDPDNDGRWNFLDADSDNDGVADGVEGAAGTDPYDPSSLPQGHTTDRDGDGRVSLSELLRVIQFYNVGGHQCASGSEDGFEPGAGPDDCTPHDGDYAPVDWRIDLSELLRAIQFFNAGGYYPCQSGEDGFCAGQPG